MSNYALYTTKQGDRLDTISTAAYGTPYAVKIITDANPALPILDFYDGGIEIAIPIIDDAIAIDTPQNLPPWKQ